MPKPQSLEAAIAPLLREGNLTLATAESCTGGLIAHLLTNVPGSSDYFLGGVVAYANEIKEGLLGVPAETLIRHGAVSEATALAMARGARQRLGADLALSVTGIAGPSGGTPEKPVGLTWIGLSASDFETARRFVWDADREENKKLSAQAALEMLQEFLETALLS